jgi:hypothetical protein
VSPNFVRGFKSCALEPWELPDRFKMVLASPCLAVSCLSCFTCCLQWSCCCLVGAAVAHEAVENVIENRTGFALSCLLVHLCVLSILPCPGLFIVCRIGLSCIFHCIFSSSRIEIAQSSVEKIMHAEKRSPDEAEEQLLQLIEAVKSGPAKEAVMKIVGSGKEALDAEKLNQLVDQLKETFGSIDLQVLSSFIQDIFFNISKLPMYRHVTLIIPKRKNQKKNIQKSRPRDHDQETKTEATRPRP